MKEFDKWARAKRYIGSSVNLKRRFLEYFNINHLIRGKSMPICRSLLKRGFSNFSLEVLEYCKVEDLMKKEKKYFELFLPEYNLCKEPGSPSRGTG
jgi:group I intron endonuclease